MPAKRAARVIIAAILINLTMGFSYSWSVFEKALLGEALWSNTAASLPYTVYLLAYSCSMLPAGMLQDRYGPRRVCFAGSLFLAAGLLVSAFSVSPWLISLGFGLLAGCGAAMCYSSSVSTPMKWVGPEHRGLVSGITIGAVGATALYMSPLANWAIERFGVFPAFLVLALAIVPLNLVCSTQLRLPAPSGTTARAASLAAEEGGEEPQTIRALLGSGLFRRMFLMFFCAATSGLLISGHITMIALQQCGWERGFYLAGIFSLFSCAGRLFGSWLSDYLPRHRLLAVIYSLNSLNMLLFFLYRQPLPLMIGTCVVGFSYGASTSVIPTMVADQFGLRNFGRNFGLITLSAGAAGITGPLLAGYLMDQSGVYLPAYLVSSLGLLAAAITAIRLKIPAAKPGQACQATGLPERPAKTDSR